MATVTNLISAQLTHEELDPRRWFAVVTAPQHEKAAFRAPGISAASRPFCRRMNLLAFGKNRQKVKVELPLFPTYLFVRIDRGERARVLCTPGVRQLVGNSREPLSLPDREIEFLRT